MTIATSRFSLQRWRTIFIKGSTANLASSSAMPLFLAVATSRSPLLHGRALLSQISNGF